MSAYMHLGSFASFALDWLLCAARLVFVNATGVDLSFMQGGHRGQSAEEQARISGIAIQGCSGGGLHIEAFDTVELVTLTVLGNGRHKEQPPADEEEDVHQQEQEVEAPAPGGGILLADIQTQVGNCHEFSHPAARCVVLD